MDICENCGMRRMDKIVDPSGPFAICPECGHKHRFLQLPLFVVSGASGAGKTTVLSRLLGRLDTVIPLDSDILWSGAFNQPETHYRTFFETWLSLCTAIHQSGRPVMVFGAGFGVPGNIEPCIQRRYFSTVHYLALVCKADELRRRLESRPEWRGCDEVFIQRQIEFNQWFIEHGSREEPKVDLFDTTGASVEETAEAVVEWRQRVGAGS